VIASLYLSSNSEASYYIMRLLSWKVLGSEWIALLIIAYSAIMVTLVVVACVIGFPHGDFRSSIRQRFLRILYSLACTANAGLVQRSVTVAAESLTA